MDEVEGLRLKPSSEDLVSLAESINLEDSHYALLRVDLESIAQNLEAASWSTIVDPNELKSLSKEAVKRQDVIYEFIQTEMHHVRTLKILLHVYMYELRQCSILDEARLFCGVESMLTLHQEFLSCLKARQSTSQEDGSPNMYQIAEFADILISQFSGAVGERMIDCYGLFCGHYSEGVTFYKEQLQSNKKLQILMRKIGQLPLVRRLGIPECFLLVTQRITKYPILVERIIQNTEADTEELRSLVQALELLKDAISQVNDQVREYENAARLREISLRLEPKSVGRLKDGKLFRREELIQGNRTLLHEGAVTWKSAVRQKDIHAVLLSDVILLLQEKDQKFVFAAVENKPAVISLQRLIVRDVAHDDKALFLISACTTAMPEMYEIITSSKEERITWTAMIRQATEHYPEEELYHELMAKLQHFQDQLKMRDDVIKQSLAEKQQIFAFLCESVLEQEVPHKGLLLRGDASDLQQGETLLKGAIDEVETLQNLLFTRIEDQNPNDEKKMHEEQLGTAEDFAESEENHVASARKYDGCEEASDGADIPQYSSHSLRHPVLWTRHLAEGTQQSADEDTDMPDYCRVSVNPSHTELCDRVVLLAQRLYSLQAIVAQQDSLIELQHAFHSKSKQPARHYSSVLLEQEKQRNAEKHKEDLANLHKLQAQQREEQQRWERERERQRVQLETLEAQLLQKVEECRRQEEKLAEEKVQFENQKEDYQLRLERLRESTQLVDRTKERVNQEKIRLQQWQEKLKKLTAHQGLSNYDDPAQCWSHQSFRSSSVPSEARSVTLPPKLQGLPASSEAPPKVPPRKESISPQPVKAELPIHLVSTTNQVQKPAAVQQQIPTKLAALSRGKDKSSKVKGSHQRTHSAASIDVSQVVPIRGTDNGGGSLRAKRNASPSRIYHPGTFVPPAPTRSVKPSQSFSTNKISSSNEAPPPVPPPFPKEILEPGKERVIFL